ncbi:DUF1108 family protein [Staphylococcus pseudintermedius]|uniref:DUF1108 family protein n=1 Tax=Staphylococcus pseudintermedius TaxID=283734 RepID=UPI0019ED30EE|nr:DUF1108 family protein [Staphylococcus pseudintermedius]EGQ3902548.1 hypothetical protein [Staphylococcus pseudintermedius]EGQ3927888.1 DUF1108 family protein [Staphylococcus pseudintermedius]EGQ3935318.1 DUF1108 family protein [Staphylococcus pseudintermedius]EHP0513638.1 DUF1108 family protein [Staphylococcus pseudintermedius]EHT7951067.1 DUF1108 family protein [Staphylococcus pseudintermedius]
MYFKKGSKVSHILNIEGFKFRRETTRENNKIRVVIMTLEYEYVDEVVVFDLNHIHEAEEVLKQSVFDYIENRTDELDKVMAYFSGGQ